MKVSEIVGQRSVIGVLEALPDDEVLTTPELLQKIKIPPSKMRRFVPVLGSYTYKHATSRIHYWGNKRAILALRKRLAE